MNNVSGRLEKETQFYQKMEQKLKTLPPVINEYFISMRANRKSYTTINVYINNVLHFAHFVYNDKLDNDFYKHITPTNVESYMISLETRETNNGTQRMGDDILQSRWSSLNYFFNWLVKRNYITENPIVIVDRPKNQTEHKVTYLSKTEINKLFKAIDQNQNAFVAKRDRTLVSLALATALRASALTNINIDDIDFDNNIINVIEKRQKVRKIDIGENTKIMLQEWIDARNQEFGDTNTPALFLSQKKGRLSIDAFTDMLTKYCADAKIQRITPHKLRASAACALAKNNIPLKALAKQLGHNNVATTMRYIDVFNEDSEKSKNILDNLF